MSYQTTAASSTLRSDPRNKIRATLYGRAADRVTKDFFDNEKHIHPTIITTYGHIGRPRFGKMYFEAGDLHLILT